MSNKIKRGQAERLLADLDFGGVGDDLRRRDASRTLSYDAAAKAVIVELFGDTSLLDDFQKVTLLVSTASEVRDQWGRARDSFLTIGKKLLTLEERLTSEEFVRLRRGHERLFPFSDSIASQFRQIARAVRSGRIEAGQCPTGYSTAYLLASLSEAELEQARREDLVRPDVSRTMVLQFRRRLAALTELQAPITRVSAVRLQNELGALDRERRELVERLRSIGQRRREIHRKLAELA